MEHYNSRIDKNINREYQPTNNDIEKLSSMKINRMDETQRWHQNQYMTDSGIHSLASSNTPSVISKSQPQEETKFEDSDSGWKSSYEPILVQPTTDSSPAPMSTESNSNSHDKICDRNLPINNSSDQKENKFPELDTDEAVNAIPDLVKLIKDEDDTIVLHQAAMMVFQLSKSEAIESLIESDEMIQVIISALNRTEDLETIRFLAGTLYNISQTQKGLRLIFLVNCIPCLVRLLSSPIESVLFYSITTLHNLLLHQDGAKDQIRLVGCLTKMTSLLAKNNVKFLTICTDCLRILAYGNQESKVAILSSGGPGELVRILRSYSYEKLLWTTARLLKVLSVCNANKPAIIEAGGLEVLSRHLHHNSQRLAINCLWTIRNISDTAAKVKNINLQPLLLSLVQLLSAGSSNSQMYNSSSIDVSVVACTAGIISNLTCNNCTNKFMVYRFGCIKGILIAMANGLSREDILEPCVCALRHLTSRHEDEERARISVVREFNGLPLIARVLYSATAGVCPDLGLECNGNTVAIPSWSLVKALVGLLRNLSINLDNHGALREHGLVTGLILLLYATLFTIDKVKKETTLQVIPGPLPPTNASQSPTLIQDVRLEEVIEGVCGALYMLMREPLNRVHLALFKGPTQLSWSDDHYLQMNTTALALFVHLLNADQHECLQRAAAGVLVEASHDKSALDVIANLPGASSRLEQLVYSTNEAIATYSSAIVIRIQEEHGCSSITNFYDSSSSRFSLIDSSNNLDTPPHTNYDSCLEFDMLTSGSGSHPNHLGHIDDEDDDDEDLDGDGGLGGSLSAMLGPPPGQMHLQQQLSPHESLHLRNATVSSSTDIHNPAIHQQLHQASLQDNVDSHTLRISNQHNKMKTNFGLYTSSDSTTTTSSGGHLGIGSVSHEGLVGSFTDTPYRNSETTTPTTTTTDQQLSTGIGSNSELNRPGLTKTPDYWM